MRTLGRAWLVAASCLLWAEASVRGQSLRGSRITSTTSGSASNGSIISGARSGRALFGLSHMAAHGKDPKLKTTEKPKPPPGGGEDSGVPERDVDFDEAFSALKIYFGENKHSTVPQAVAVGLSGAGLNSLLASEDTEVTAPLGNTSTRDKIHEVIIAHAILYVRLVNL